METCMVSQYDFNTGTSGVISGSIQLSPATIKIVDANIAVAARPPNDFLENSNPDNTVVKAI